MSNARQARRRTFWCIWGAFLAAIPYTLRSSSIFTYESPGLIAPLQCAVPAIAAAVAALAFMRLWGGERLEKALVAAMPFAGPALAVLTLPTIALCELGYLPMRLGNLVLLDYEPAFDVVGGFAQALSFLGWALYGTFCVGSEEARAVSSPQSQRTLAATLGTAALLPTLASLATATLVSWPPLQVAICLASGLGTWLFLRCATRREVPRDRFMLQMVLALGALLCAASFREATSEILSPVLGTNPRLEVATSIPLALACFASFFASVAGATWLSARTRRDVTHAAPSALLDTREAVELLPHGATLSERQRDVLILAIEGLSRKEIAQRLGISAGTAGTHLTRGLDHMELSSADELAKAVALEREMHAQAQQLQSARPRHRAVGMVYLAAIIAPFVFKLPFWCVLPGTYALAAIFCLPSLARMARQGGAEQNVERPSNPQAAFSCLMFLPLGILVGKSWQSFASPVLYLGLVTSIALAVCLMGIVDYDNSTDPRKILAHPTSVMASGLHGLFECLPEATLMFGCGCGMYYLIYSLPTVLLNQQGLFLLVFALHIALLNYMIKKIFSCCHADNKQCAISKSGTLDHLLAQGLSPTEANVVLLSSQGYTRSQICKKLLIAEGTVNSCRATAYKKLGVHSISELKSLLDK